MLVTSSRKRDSINKLKVAKPYCECFTNGTPKAWDKLSGNCTCGEETDVSEWKWEVPDSTQTWVIMSDDRKQVTFHPFYSSGTANVKGDTPLQLNHHYYWEVKMLSEVYGTDIMVGLGTDKVNMESQYKFMSYLGQDAESYGLSYFGMIRHDGTSTRQSSGFCKGSIVGVRLDLWQGTLEFYLNRQPQGISFFNLRRHTVDGAGALFPMLSSTAAQSSLRLTYASSWRESLLVGAARSLAASLPRRRKVRLPPGLWHSLHNHFWLTLPTEGCVLDDDDEEMVEMKPVKVATSVLDAVLPSPYMNGFYMDSVEREFRVVVWE